jgi:Tfp pilus assembly protein PilV
MTMTRIRGSATRGFALLEALIALLVAALALAAVVRLQGTITKSSGDAVARSEALTVAQQRIESLRALASTRTGFDDSLAPTDGEVCVDVADRATNTSFERCESIAATAGGLDSRDVSVSVRWTDANGDAQAVVLASTIGWDDPLSQALSARPPTGSIIAPVGDAKRGSGQRTPFPIDAVDNGDGTFTHTDGLRRELLAANGDILLYLEPKNGEPQSFTVIRGRIYFDQNAGSGVPAPADVLVRLSSEGVCVQPNQDDPVSVTAGSNAYAYFDYACYVGPGWYGNVGVSNSTLVSAHSTSSATRTYRGFRASGGTYLSTGVAGGRGYPSDGLPVPAQFSYPGYGEAAAQGYFNHHFLLTRLQGQDTCKSKMEGGQFAYNAGKYFCINPHNSPDAAVCPSVWPNFESEVGTGGTINFTLDVVVQGKGVVTGSAGGINCGKVCSASFVEGSQVVLTASTKGQETFVGWSGGGCSGTGTCSVTMDAAKTVTAVFSGAADENVLTLSKLGSGSGTVAGGTIDCGPGCSGATETYAAPTTLTLTATAGPGSTFLGWSGACSGTGSCEVSVTGAVTVTANFGGAGGSTCNTVVRGSLPTSQWEVLAPTPSGVGTCSKEGKVSNYSCNLTAAQGTMVQLSAQQGAKTSTLGVQANCATIEGADFPKK